MNRFVSLPALLLATCLAIHAQAQGIAVGETHRMAHLPSAALRNADHSDGVRVTVWYPAQAGAAETPLRIGPTDAFLFESGSAARDARLAHGRFPVVLFSHGNGGTARMMGWFGTALARAGYVVIAVDHPGNNGLDPMTLAGGTLIWDRAEDLRAALDLARADPAIGPHLDMRRLGVAGFSLGGFTALLTLGARADIDHFIDHCRVHPDDTSCLPQAEAPDQTLAAQEAALETPALAAEARHAGSDHAIPGIKAAFLIAPGAISVLDPASLDLLEHPVSILLGQRDAVAPPAINGALVARRLPDATLKALADVGHYDFLGRCTAVATARIALCQDLHAPQQETHDAATSQAIAFFDTQLKGPGR